MQKKTTVFSRIRFFMVRGSAAPTENSISAIVLVGVSQTRPGTVGRRLTGGPRGRGLRERLTGPTGERCGSVLAEGALPKRVTSRVRRRRYTSNARPGGTVRAKAKNRIETKPDSAHFNHDLDHLASHARHVWEPGYKRNASRTLIRR